MADQAPELSVNIEFLPNIVTNIFPIPKHPICDHLSDFEFQLISSLAKVKDDRLYKLLKPVYIDEQLQCWFRSKDWSCYTTVNGRGGHRVAYELFIGPVINEICHHCDRKGCVNPWHLFQGTHSDNIRDAQVKGRIYPFKVGWR